MKKIVLSLIFIVSSIFADVKSFIGLEIGNTTLNTSVTPSQYIISDIKKTPIGLKVGFIKDISRTYISLKLLDSKYNISRQGQAPITGDILHFSFTANYDFLIKHDKLYEFIPYIGAHLGAEMTSLGDNDSFDPEINLDYGFQLGVLKDINEDISFELGYRYTSINNSFRDRGIKIKLENQNALFFGINYNF